MKKKSDELPFTMDQILAEIESARPKTLKFHSLSEDQRKFIIACRGNDRPVPYPKMSAMWTKFGWGEADSGTIRGWADRLVKK